MTVRRLTVAVAVLVVAAIAYTIWQVWAVQRDLSRAEAGANQLITSVRQGDAAPARDRALSRLTTAVDSARDRTDGAWWGLLTHVPIVGDDAEGIQVLSASLADVARDGAGPLTDGLDDLDGLTQGGQVDLDAVREVQEPLGTAYRSFARADAEVGSLDSSGYAGVLRTRFDGFRTRLSDITDALAAADKAAEVLPTMLGGEGPRRYLLVFQSNAEIRATGGLPGSWAELTADDGRVRIEQQGTGAEFGRRATPVLPLSAGEEAVYADLLGTFFLDANFTPDFPRAAQLMAARWQEEYDGSLDGVISLDPVALSYLLEGIGPVRVDDVRLTSENAVDELLNGSYLRLDEAGQDAFFADAARAIFDAATDDLRSPLTFVRALSRSADERRFLLAPFRDEDREALGESDLYGALPDDAGKNPYVNVALNDATGSKMSYYLRYGVDVEAAACQDGRQMLLGGMNLRQTVSAAEGAQLPESVTGPGRPDIEKGTQLVAVRIYSPTGGTVSDVKVDGTAIEVFPVDLNGRQVATLFVVVTGRDDTRVTWAMETGADQTGYGTVAVTPSVVPGSKDTSFQSAC